MSALTHKRQSRNCRLVIYMCSIMGVFYIVLYNVIPFVYPGDSFSRQTPKNVPPTRSQLLKDILNCKDRPLTREVLKYGDFWMVRNFVRGTKSTNMSCAESITYTTNGDFSFFENLPELVKRWNGPISFAVFAPGSDFNVTVDAIQYVRHCLVESLMIRQYVSIHIYFPAIYMPDVVPTTDEDLVSWTYSCAKKATYETVPSSDSFRTIHNMTYPINVGRNIARKAANTYFILASDIELYPSLGLIDQFLDMVLNKTTRSKILDQHPPRVFPIPVFEIDKNVSIPENKKDLAQLFRKRKAVPFHKHVCASCHLIPNQTEWVYEPYSEHLSVHNVVKREKKLKHWEPFYISDNREPYFDERVTWEGQSNKRIQNYAMCLLGFNYFILHPAFLVHSPGIKHFDKSATRLKYVPETNRFIKNVIGKEYRVVYGKNPECAV